MGTFGAYNLTMHHRTFPPTHQDGGRTSWRWTPFIHDSSHGAELSFYTRIYLNYHNLYSNYHNQFKIKYLWLYSNTRFQSNLRFCNCAHGRGWDLLAFFSAHMAGAGILQYLGCYMLNISVLKNGFYLNYHNQFKIKYLQLYAYYYKQLLYTKRIYFTAPPNIFTDV